MSKQSGRLWDEQCACDIFVRARCAPNFFNTSGSTIRDANTRLKIVRNSLSKPPTPYFSNDPFESISCRCFWLDPGLGSLGGSGIKFRFPAGPVRVAPSVNIATPKVGAFTTVVFATGFS
jgi:hypothetical protein